MYVLDNDEAIIYDGKVRYQKGNMLLTLTSKRMIFEKVTGMFKKTLKVVDEVLLDDIILYKNKVQIKQNKRKLKIQTTNRRIIIIFDSLVEATKVKEKIINLKTGLNMVERTSNNIKDKAVKGATVAAVGTVATGAAYAIIKNSKVIVKNVKLIAKGAKDIVKSIIKK